MNIEYELKNLSSSMYSSIKQWGVLIINSLGPILIMTWPLANHRRLGLVHCRLLWCVCHVSDVSKILIGDIITVQPQRRLNVIDKNGKKRVCTKSDVTSNRLGYRMRTLDNMADTRFEVARRNNIPKTPRCSNIRFLLSPHCGSSVHLVD